ncbi:TetR/AcrR family transcriptional regulator [Catenulispora subtropica]|uniref:TetR family transcriptional regulator n=1 Tax=Catenulispora subtropica TaxID=450798 RepID=A0ABP5DQG6_9ACTN
MTPERGLKQSGTTPRPRDAEATKALLLHAATEEFAEHGLAGARVDRIAERAGANKRLIYVYFGDKDRLFDAVVDDQSRAVMAAVPLPDGDLVAFAAARFDYVRAHPEARRIAHWRAFERSEPTHDELAAYRLRVESIEAAQREGRLRTDIPAAELFAIVLRISESWLAAPSALWAADGRDPLSPERLASHRDSMLAAVRSVVQVPG